MKFAPKKLRNEKELAKTLAEFNERLTAAQKINDPADRLEAMLQLEKDVGKHASGIYSRIIDRSMLVDAGSIGGTIVTAVGAGIGLSLVATPAVGIPAMVVMLGGGIFGLFKLDPSTRFEKRVEKELEPHLKALNEILTVTDKDADNLLKTCTNQIAASEKFDSLYDRYPGIRDSFIKAFNKAVALKELPPPPQPQSGGPKLAL